MEIDTKIMVIEVDGTIKMEDVTPNLEWLQKTVGGYIEVVPFVAGKIIVVDEEGIPKGYQLNVAATELCGIPLYGSVIIMDSELLD